MCTSDLNSDFTYAWSDRLHRFPIVWIQSLLHAPQLETGQPSRKSRERPKTPRELPSQMSGLSGIGHASIQVFVSLSPPSGIPNIPALPRYGPMVLMRCRQLLSGTRATHARTVRPRD